MTLLHKADIDALLRQAIDQHFSNSALESAIRYAMIPAGKLLRPLLSATLARELGWAGDLSWTIALEFLHVASLIHDDLPALDNDNVRRGRAALHRKFDESTAILAADALIAAAFSSALAQDSGGAARVRILSRAFVLLCNGQQLDLNPSGRSSTEIATLKTGALFGAACEMSYVTACQSGSKGKEFYAVGEGLGIAFQAQDDRSDGKIKQVISQTSSIENICQNFSKLTINLEATIKVVRSCLSLQ